MQTVDESRIRLEQVRWYYVQRAIRVLAVADHDGGTAAEAIYSACQAARVVETQNLHLVHCGYE